jgi:hypothetical protein
MSYTHLIQRVLEKDGWSGFLTRGLKTKCEFLHFGALAQHQMLQIRCSVAHTFILDNPHWQAAYERHFRHRFYNRMAVYTRMDGSQLGMIFRPKAPQNVLAE